MELIRHTIAIESPVWEVYEIVSTLGGLRSWLSRDVQGNPRKDGELSLGFGPERSVTFHVLETKSNKRVSWKLTASTFDRSDAGIGTEVRFNMKEAGSKSTEIELTHTGWSEVDEYFRVCGYQWQKSLQSLKKVCETGLGEPLTPSMLVSKKATGWFPVT
ncbi:MAG TPA: SRPBCC domain-containing protein [Candidatus Paceibacterota bacterium]|nr:SRPBCC domain-containing protein [Candidatus Paceibacterota bacterium]